MFTKKEEILLQWLFGDVRKTDLLDKHYIRDLDVLIDPDTTLDGIYVGTIPHFLSGSEILAEIRKETTSQIEKSRWSGLTTILFYLPLINMSNDIVNSFWPQNPRLMGSCKMIQQDHLDRLISQNDLVHQYLTQVPPNPMDIESYDQTFATQHRLPVYVLHMDPFEKIRGDKWPEMADVLVFFNEVLLAVYMYYLPSTLLGGKKPKYVYTPSNPDVLSVSDFALTPE